jgi:carbon-monoxide dehydrogenase large subunit
MNAKEGFVAGYVGAPVERIEDLRLLRGEGKYTDDYHLHGMLHAAIVRSGVAHGLLRGVDGAAALKLPGVRAVYSGADVAAALGAVPRIPMRLAPLPELVPFEQPVLADGRVRYVGEPVAIVLADTAALAEDALEAVVVDIEPLPAVTERDDADAAGVFLFDPAVRTNCAFTFMGISGDADAAFADAPYVRKERFEVQRYTAMTMEMRGFLAEWDAKAGLLRVHGSCKVAFDNRRMLAKMLQMEEHAIDMVETDVGGSFGMRGEFYPEDFLIPFAARQCGRPVKWAEDRREHMLTANHARDTGCELEIACTRDGRILAMRGVAHTDIGAYIRTNGSMASRNVAQVSVGPYRIPHVKYAVSMVVTNKTPVGTYRGPGRFETDFFRERLLDLAAADLGIDRVEFRRRNLVPPEGIPHKLVTLVPGGDTLTDSGDYRITLDRCLEVFGWDEKVKLNGKLVDGRHHGVAVGCYLEGGGIGPSEHARMVMEPDGRIAVHVGSSGNGQGLETIVAQIAADSLGVPIARIRGVFHGSTAGTLNGFGAYSSRSTVMGGSAVVNASNALMLALKQVAAARLGCAVEDVLVDKADPQAERYSRAGGGASVSLLELVAVGPLSVDGVFHCDKRTYSYGAHATHVAVDARTGHVQVLDYVAVEDVGRIVNPLTLHGQTIGAVVQGLGGVFLEHLQYDEHGQMLTGTLADYLLPTASDFPLIRGEAMELFPSPHNPLGVKGAGEGGIISVGGVVANAIAAALQSYGVKPNRMPLSPPRIWEMLNQVPA